MLSAPLPMKCDHFAAVRKHSTVTAEPNLATVVECDAAAATAANSEHVIRLQVKGTLSLLVLIAFLKNWK